jgi:hypothetical protein
VRIGRLDWVDEPLAMTDRLREAGFVARTYVKSTEPGIEAAMREVLKGRVGYLRVYPGLARRLLLKFVRLNRMMRWTMEHFGLRAGVLFVRHPCAVVSSCLELAARTGSVWGQVTSPAPTIPEYLRSAVDSLTRTDMSVERVLAINWALDHAVPMVHEPPPHTMVVSYESLVLDPDDVVRRLCDHCRIAHRPVDTELPSPTASPDFQPATQIEKWRDRLSPRAQAEIREVVSTIMPTFDDIAADLGMPAW